ncbi:hypothetical protein [Wolbachia endosymbiont (group A) of Brachyopa scutellaris]|uniref:hypothetical protein n=1 Tax=Wolbachia endosymbiont (group A) of Brachyopa scutellaris TaxID=3066140 RepID=UPI003132DD5E
MQPHQKHSFSVRSATFHTSLLVHKQTFLDPSVKHWDDKKRSTGMTPFAVQFTFKNECSYSYGINRGIAIDSVNCLIKRS